MASPRTFLRRCAVLETPSVSITIVVYNSEDVLPACLESIRDDVESGFAEVIVVDNASPDRSLAVVERLVPQATIVQSSTNRLFAGGCNLAWPHVRARYWLLLNPDVVVPERGVRDLVGWMDEHPSVGAASPVLVDRGGRSQGAARRFPTVSRTLLECSRLHRLLPERVRADYFLGSYFTGSTHLDVDWVPGAALIVRRQAVKAAGLLAEDVPMFAEDSEWCWRIKKSGWRIGVCGAVRFEHEEGASARRTWGETQRVLRIWKGIYASTEKRRGLAYARLLALLNACAFAIESVHPRRSSAERAAARRTLHAHRQLVRERRAQHGYRHGVAAS